ncbi:hypothetical protein L596_007192 [Steinernema carpocapsae]|uniref:RRM domain-containing protein n=1 Tax=Steinernema carpocapsae TaxID=34508 RepID=A0A4U5P9J6_STECR|nr:hypothetical protein L596_007192 [Steinernema carpocapsae]
MGNRDERTLYVSNLADKVTSNLLEELFVQLSPLEAVYLNEGQHRYALITLNDPDSVQYVCDKLDNIKLWSLPSKFVPKEEQNNSESTKRSLVDETRCHLAIKDPMVEDSETKTRQV